MMSQTQRERLGRISRYATAPAVAGVLLIGPAALFAAPPTPTNLAPSAYLQDDEDDAALLSDYDINLIQVYEINLDGDDKPRIRIEREALEAFLEDPAYADREGMPRGRDEIRAFMRAEGWEQLKLFFQMRARDYYGEAQVQEEPQSMRDWQRLNDRYLLQYFERTFANRPLGDDVQIQFKGRPIAEIPLLGRGRDGKAIAYTNFYILSQITVDGIPMIDRDRPMDSILIQWGLPREDARYDAPEIEGWRPHFRDADDEARLEPIVDWILSLQKFNQGSQYGSDYLPPALRGDDEDQ